MRKLIIFHKRAAGLDRAAFDAWALAGHCDLVTRIPGLRRCTISIEVDGDTGAFDAATELWFDDTAAVAAGLASEAGLQVQADVAAHASQFERVETVEHPFVDTGLPARFKLLAPLKRRADMTRAEFKSWWLDRHAPLVVVFPELRRYQVDIVEDGPEAFVDGIAEVSFGDLETLKRIMSRTQVKDVQQDSQVHTVARYRMFGEEHPVF